MRRVQAVLVMLALVPRVAVAAPPAPPPNVARCLDASEEGQRLRDDGKLSAARPLFETCSATTCPPVVRTNCAAWLEGLQQAMPTIVPSVRDDRGNDLLDATLRIDGAAPEKITGRPIEVDLGAHVLELSAPGFVSREEKLLVVSGEKNRIVRVELKRPELPPAPAVPSNPVAHDEGSSIPALSYALAGVGIVAGGFSIGLGLTTRSDISALEGSPCAATKTCAQDDVDSLRTRLVVADVLLGVAVASIVVAGVAWALSGRSARH